MKILCSVILVFFLAGFFVGCGDGRQLSAGDFAPDFRLDTLSHERFYLNQYRGKVVVLVFWNTRCSVCKEEMVALKSFPGMRSAENLVVAAVCTDPENIDDLKKILKSLGIDYPVLLDRRAEVFRKYNFRAYPTTIVIDQEGKVNLVRLGYDALIREHLRSTVENLLAN